MKNRKAGGFIISCIAYIENKRLIRAVWCLVVWGVLRWHACSSWERIKALKQFARTN